MLMEELENRQILMDQNTSGCILCIAVIQHIHPLTNIYFQEAGEHGKGKDFISLSLQNGRLVFR